MHRLIPKLVVLAGIGVVVLIIVWKLQLGRRPDPGVVYINPNIEIGNR